MATIIITWKSFTEPTQSTSATVSFNYNAELTPHARLCDYIFEQTNLYRGQFWDLLEPVLPANRSHTALSVGDEITIYNHNNGFTYRCAHWGWELTQVEINGKLYNTTELETTAK